MSKHPITITIQNGYYVMKSPRDQRLIDGLKSAINYTHRQWDGQQFAWIIHPKAINSLVAAIERAGYERPEIPAIDSTAIQTVITKTLRVEYLGQCKEREDKVVSALASLNVERPYYDQAGKPRYQWPVEFPEQVLKAFFEHAPKSGEHLQTFYQVLCIFESASPDEIKSAHRRLARQWHPDVCSEENAADKFRELTDAYEILRDPQKRKRYDTGLFFEREARKKPEPEPEMRFGKGYHIKSRKFENKYFRAPLRCGLVTAEGVQKLNRFTVTKIISWDDITDTADRVMTTSWNKFTESIQIKWL